MNSIREIFVTGFGPSSSHTMGPANATKYVLDKYKDKDIQNIEVTLYSSLALTGKGHLTDYIIDKTLSSFPHSIVFDEKTAVSHPNTIKFVIFTSQGSYEEKIISIGGGSIKSISGENLDKNQINNVYKESLMKDILSYCEEKKLSLVDYVLEKEDKKIISYIEDVKHNMREAIIKGEEEEGVLPGKLAVKRKAKEILRRAIENGGEAKELAVAASFAVAEENASGNKIVIAPTCGSAGVIPGVITYLKEIGISEEKINNGLLVAGLVGQLCKTNGTIAGAIAGCQAEIGVASCMGAALVATCFGFSNNKIAQSAEIALEHSLGLTCDPVQGYVQIPCIERCAMFALKAINAVELSKLIPSSTTFISFDDSVKTMFETGKDLARGYRETSEKGLAELLK